MTCDNLKYIYTDVSCRTASHEKIVLLLQMTCQTPKTWKSGDFEKKPSWRLGSQTRRIRKYALNEIKNGINISCFKVFFTLFVLPFL